MIKFVVIYKRSIYGSQKQNYQLSRNELLLLNIKNNL